MRMSELLDKEIESGLLDIMIFEGGFNGRSWILGAAVEMPYFSSSFFLFFFSLSFPLLFFFSYFIKGDRMQLS